MQFKGDWSRKREEHDEGDKPPKKSKSQDKGANANIFLETPEKKAARIAHEQLLEAEKSHYLHYINIKIEQEYIRTNIRNPTRRMDWEIAARIASKEIARPNGYIYTDKFEDETKRNTLKFIVDASKAIKETTNFPDPYGLREGYAQLLR